MRRFTVNCFFCGAKNHKRSPQQRTYKCQSCGEVNFGPGMKRALVKLIEISTPPGRKGKAEVMSPAAAVADQTTVIKTTPLPSAKSAPKVKPKAPTAPPKEPAANGKRSWNPFYG